MPQNPQKTVTNRGKAGILVDADTYNKLTRLREVLPYTIAYKACVERGIELFLEEILQKYPERKDYVMKGTE